MSLLYQLSAFSIQAKIAAGTFGKRSNFDVKWSRDFIKQKANKLNNYIGVKYHVQTTSPGYDRLHNFKNGYCGISKIEDNKYCLCYLTTAENLKANNNSIALMEKNFLHKNPFLKEIFSTAKFLPSLPVTISQISFDKKSQVENHVLMIGDAAGMITPLCGNGMSMALHGSKIAFECIDNFLNNKITGKKWKINIAANGINIFKTLVHGRILQNFLEKNQLTNLFIRHIKHFPFIIRQLISSTHGRPFSILCIYGASNCTI